MKGTARRIGLLWPSDGLNDREFWRLLPNDVSLLIARYAVGGTLDLGQLRRDGDLDTLLDAVRLLRKAEPDLICLGDCAGGFVAGAAAERFRTESLEITAGVPVVAMSTALAKALMHVGAKRVALLSPYRDEVTECLHEFLKDHGIEVLCSHSLAFDDEFSIDGMKSRDWLDAARSADSDGAQALAVAGGGVSLSPLISHLEATLGKPVIFGPGALMWAALARLGVRCARSGWGALAHDHLDEEASVVASDMPSFLSRATKTYAVSSTPPVFAGAEGSWLFDIQGKRYLDFACGSGTTNLGHQHPAIMDAIESQMNTGLTHLGPHFLSAEQVRLYGRLRQVLPIGLARFHPATNGTEATETAIKAAMHFTGHKRFLAFEGGYHGRTLGALAVSENKGPNRTLGRLAPNAAFAPYGCDETELVQALDGAVPLAGIIVEPIQATGGMILPPSGWMKSLAQHASAREIPLIVDEVFTGMGRTGQQFAFMGEDFVPDLLILGKAFAGGFPAGLVAGREDILSAWLPGTQSSTFQLHPVSAAAALASVEFMLRHDVSAKARQIGTWLSASAALLGNLPFVSTVRGRGAMFGVEIVDETGRPDHARATAIRAAALAHGLITWECGTQGHVIGIVPPLTIAERELLHGIELLREAIDASARCPAPEFVRCDRR